MDTLFTVGFHSWTLEEVAVKVEALEALLVDVRRKAKSHKVGFKKRNLKMRLREQYLHVPELANADEKEGSSGRSKIANFEAGRKKIGARFRTTSPKTFVLMCGCLDPDDCHRSVVAAKLAEKQHLDVVHLAAPSEAAQGRLFDSAA